MRNVETETMVGRDCDEGLPTFHTEVTVTDPITHYSCGNGRHTTYLVVLESDDVCFSQPRSLVRRRFSEFVFLRRLLKATHPTVVISEPLYLSNRALHLFLQTNLPMREIEAQITGVVPIIPLEESDCHSFASDSSVSTGSSGGSECRTCDSLRKSISLPDPKSVSLLSTNHEAFVTSVPFLPCSSDIHIMPRKLFNSKDLGHSVEPIATSSTCSSSAGVPKPTCDSSASINIESIHLRKTVSFSDAICIKL